MLKLILAVGIAVAAFFGLRKMMGGSADDEFEQAYTPPTNDATGYVPQPQP